MTKTKQSDDKHDRFTPLYDLWTLFLFIVILTVIEINTVYSFNLLVWLFLILSVLLWIVILLWKSIAYALRRQWRLMLSALFAPFFVFAVFLFMAAIGLTPERVRLEIKKPHYAQEIAQLPLSEGFRVKVWPWGENGSVLGGFNIFYFLVYDESDQITLPPNQRSAEWMKKAEKAAEGNGFYMVLHPEGLTSDTARLTDKQGLRKIQGHYYLLTEVWD